MFALQQDDTPRFTHGKETGKATRRVGHPTEMTD
jgi:hypothetical protein